MKETIMTHNSIHQSCFERGELELLPQTASGLPQAAKNIFICKINDCFEWVPSVREIPESARQTRYAHCRCR